METTPKIGLPLIAAGQAQKHITHNEALSLIDDIIHLAVESASVDEAPAEAAELALYIVPAAASGVWQGHAGEIARFEGGTWRFITPQPGWTAWVKDQAALKVFTGTDWLDGNNIPPAITVETLGINANADSFNRLSVASEATLLNHAGTGHQLKLNKATVSDTASLLFQDGFSGRAEMGLAGEDAFSIKVSADGSAWQSALRVHPALGAPSWPNLPAFHAKPSATAALNSASYDVLPFGNVTYNKGGHYDSASSAFTAPISGLYHFTVAARFDNVSAGSHMRLFICRNGSDEGYTLGHILVGDGGGISYPYHSLSLASILPLVEGDVITLKGGRYGGGSSLNLQSCWSGVLIG